MRKNNRLNAVPRTRHYVSSRTRKLIPTEIAMIMLAMLWFLPIWYLLVTTVKTPAEASANPLGLPQTWVFQNYVEAWNKIEFPRSILNTVIITACSVVLVMLFGSLAGYALARTKTRYSSRLFLFFLCGLIVPFQMNIISLYKIVKVLGLMNNLAAVILVNVAINTPQAVFLCKEFIESTVMIELEEAAEIDGCGVFSKFFKIVLPLLKPVLSTLAIIISLNVWNEFLTPLLFLQSRENDVLLQEVSRTIGQFSTDWTAMFPMLVMGAAPMIVFYIFMQKNIIGGVAAGAVKG